MDTLFALRDELCADPNLQPYELKIRTAFNLAMVKQRDLIDKLCEFVAFYEGKVRECETKVTLFEPVCQKMVKCVEDALNSDELPQEAAKFIIFHQEQILETLQACETVSAIDARKDGRAAYVRVFTAIVKALQLTS